MGLILDTSVIVAAERQQFDLEAMLESNGSMRFYIASITASELLHGVHRAASSKQRQKRSLFVEAILETFPIIPFDLSIARSHAALWASLEMQGRIIGHHDMQIAATALEREYRLATLNIGEFARVPNLGLLDVAPFRLL